MTGNRIPKLSKPTIAMNSNRNMKNRRSANTNLENRCFLDLYTQNTPHTHKTSIDRTHTQAHIHTKHA